MMMLWAWAGVPLGVYNIVEAFNIALRIQPQILTLLSLVTWVQCYHYQEVLLFQATRFGFTWLIQQSAGHSAVLFLPSCQSFA